ncbi:NUDIX hydrolase [Amycolatopsis sp. cmx-8-4]|uniref:NUDIX hydrolase n=1 Tax=Amycolatopsis sp. cmx-8-4 TaxID=2790947 RepID=UPI00397BE425
MAQPRPTTPAAAAIRAIPGNDESPVAVADICRVAGLGGDSTAAGALLVSFLNVFGVLEVRHDAGRELVRAATPNAALFLRSLARYLESEHTILDNWGRNGTADPPYDEEQVLSGTQFLYVMERRRLRLDPAAETIRSAAVSQIVVNRIGHGRERQFLLLYDDGSRQYQLPGGHGRRGDGSPREVAVRELQEELPGFVLDTATDRLTELGTVDVAQVSRTNGAATNYRITFFHLRSTRADLAAGPNASWVPESLVLSGDGEFEGRTINVTGLRMLNSVLADGIKELGPSVQASGQQNWLVTTARARPLEFWGLAVGILGLVLAVVVPLLM